MNPGNGHNDLYELYVLGLVEEPERGRIEEDLRRNDPAAQTRLRRALETNAILGTLAPDVAPSKQLRRRVLSIAEPQASRFQCGQICRHQQHTLRAVHKNLRHRPSLLGRARLQQPCFGPPQELERRLANVQLGLHRRQFTLQPLPLDARINQPRDQTSA